MPLLVGLRIAGSGAVGTASFVVNDANFKVLSKQVDRDLGMLESLVHQWESSVDSLAEVVLQNRRGLGLLFMKQRGLCMALGETCCFYANKSGIIRDTLGMMRQNLKEREVQREARANWYQGLFSWSPWLMTLLTALAGPLALLLVVTVGPCVINCLMSYIQKRLAAVKLLFIRERYQA